MARERILVAQPPSAERGALREALQGAGFEVIEAGSGEEALGAISGLSPDAVLADVGVAPAGRALVEGARAVGSDAAVVVVAAPDEVRAAAEALRAGAESHLVRPLDPPRAVAALEKALENRRLRGERERLRERLRERVQVVGSSPAVQLASDVVRRAAPTKAAVLVAGEPGTGKALLAQVLHEASPRRRGPFVRMNCAALSEALVEADLFGADGASPPEVPGRCEGKALRAEGGTLFLEEVASLAPAAQVRLLRLLQRGEIERAGGREAARVDVRVVAATSRDLAEEVRAGRFREDLFYRLGVVTAQLPPLRRRKGDIPALAGHFVGLAARAAGKGVGGVAPGTLSALLAYDWPGNVGELEGALERAVGSCEGPLVGAGDLPPALRALPGGGRSGSALIPGATLFEIEREAILRTLEEAGGSTTRAAGVLGISVRKVQYRLKEYLVGPPGRGAAAHRPG